MFSWFWTFRLVVCFLYRDFPTRKWKGLRRPIATGGFGSSRNTGGRGHTKSSEKLGRVEHLSSFFKAAHVEYVPLVLPSCAWPMVQRVSRISEMSLGLARRKRF